MNIKNLILPNYSIGIEAYKNIKREHFKKSK